MRRPLLRVAVLVSLAVGLFWVRPASAAVYLDDWHPYQTYWAVEWSAAVPVTGLRANFVSDTGWLNGGFAVRVGTVQRLAVGVAGYWNSFDQTYPLLTIENGNFTFTGPVYRRLSAFTALATFHYYLTQTTLQPFIGIGAGGVWTSSLQQFANRPDTTYANGFVVMGEAGLLLTVVQQLGLYVSGRYQLNLATFGGSTNPQWASGQLGVAYYF